MRNEVFEKMNTDYAIRPSESEQEFMERILKAALEYDPKLDTFNEKLAVELISCDAKERSAVFGFTPESWMCNQNNILHGAVSSGLHDVCMGLLAKYYLDNKWTTVTVQMNVEFIRPIFMTIPIAVKAYCVKSGSKIFFARADIVDRNDGSVLCSGTAMYM